eukprot:jgi/Mesvir1/5307/Mv15403-RA.2
MEEFVGARTTLRLVNRDHVGFCDPSSQYCLQQVTSDVMLRQYQMVKAAAPSRPIFAMEPAFTESIVTDEMLRPTLGLVGIHLALALCDQVRLFGFVRNWLGYMHFHYHDDYAPRESQQLAHPCLLGTNSPCNGCPEGATCAPGIPFPLPEPGFCYGHGNPVRTLDGIHHAAKALPFADERRSCFRSCGDDEGKAAGICPGGPTGICPEDVVFRPCNEWSDDENSLDNTQPFTQLPSDIKDLTGIWETGASQAIDRAKKIRVALADQMRKEAGLPPAGTTASSKHSRGSGTRHRQHKGKHDRQRGGSR